MGTKKSSTGRKRGKSWVVWAVVLLLSVICLFSMAYLRGSSPEPSDNPAYRTLLEESYILDCGLNDFTVYHREVSDETSAGLVRGYISTSAEISAQFDYYEFKSEKLAQEAYDRIVAWVKQYGEPTEVTSTYDSEDCVVEVGNLYFRAHQTKTMLVYLVCTDPENLEYASRIVGSILD